MKIAKGTHLQITSSRKGQYMAVAEEDFDTADEWYPVIVGKAQKVVGMSEDWLPGEQIPCRGSFVKELLIIDGDGIVTEVKL